MSDQRSVCLSKPTDPKGREASREGKAEKALKLPEWGGVQLSLQRQQCGVFE